MFGIEQTAGVILLEVTILVWLSVIAVFMFTKPEHDGLYGDVGGAFIYLFSLCVLFGLTLVAWGVYWWVA